MKQHANIPVFIPHLGCPNQCVFCNQRHISGVRSFDANDVIPTIEQALKTIPVGTEVEIAFFGGSFTGIDRGLMLDLLKIANNYLHKGLVHSIRCSTRPDYINEDILDTLKLYGVKTIELGLQSVSDSVLCACKRGHDFAHEREACRLIVKSGFDLVGQMMIGLPGSTPESEMETAKFIIDSGAVGARIYPTVVFKDTELYNMTLDGRYIPLTAEEAVSRSIGPLRRFIDAGVEVIRIGLCSSENLSSEDTFYAGPNHPALGEIVISRVYYLLISELLEKHSCHGRCVTVKGPRGSISKMVGQKKENKTRLVHEFGLSGVKFRESDALGKYELNLEFEGDTECI